MIVCYAIEDMRKKRLIEKINAINLDYNALGSGEPL